MSNKSSTLNTTEREALDEFLQAQDALDNHEYQGINGEDYFVLMRRRNRARDELDAAMKGDAHVR